MKLLLCKNIEKLGIVGDVVDVAAGYGRNYLVPLGLATEPTQANVRALAEDRRAAELDRARERAELESLADRMKDVEVTIRARTNEEGVLYGSVGAREIVEALADEGYYLKPEQIALGTPIRHLDNISVDIVLGEDLRSSVKVWVVREKTVEDGADDSDEDEATAGREAGTDDDPTREA